jgi:hypothetical protein
MTFHRIAWLIEDLHRRNPELGQIKVIDTDAGIVTSRNGPPYTASAEEHPFRIESDQLHYRGFVIEG